MKECGGDMIFDFLFFSYGNASQLHCGHYCEDC